MSRKGSAAPTLYTPCPDCGGRRDQGVHYCIVKTLGATSRIQRCQVCDAQVGDTEDDPGANIGIHTRRCMKNFPEGWEEIIARRAAQQDVLAQRRVRLATLRKASKAASLLNTIPNRV